MDMKLAGAVDNLWNSEDVKNLSPVEALAYRSNLLGSDRAVANYGGGNTSTKATERDHTGQEREVMWVKGSGGDLADISPAGFTGLKLDEVRSLMEREEMSDEEMVAYLAKCQVGPDMPRSSIETLLHAFVPYQHVDHTHADAINMICAAENGETLARECFGDDAVWIPYIRPGFTLSKQVGEAVRDNPQAALVLLAKHGLVTWGETPEKCYNSTIETINRAAEFVAEKSAGKEPFGGPRISPISPERRDDVLAAILPTLRGAVSGATHKILRADTSDDVMEFVCGEESPELSQVGAACPDHLVQTKVHPLWIEFDPENENEEELKEKLIKGADRYRREYEGYFSRYEEADEEMNDPNPRVVLISGIGLVSVGTDHKSSTLARDFYHRAIAVMRGASTIDTFVSLDEKESYAVEYWPLELYKLTLKPPAQELEGKVAFVTGGAGGIGSAVARTLDAHGACVIVADLDERGAARVTEELGNPGEAVGMDVTQEEAVIAAYRKTTLAYGGVDIVVSNAGLASGASVEETSVEMWERDHAILTKGYFLVSREAFKVLKEQDNGGALVFVASKNSLAAGKNASAYSTAKAAELHLARCLAEEGGAQSIRVNTVNPDAVLQGSKIWNSSWREERAKSYGIEPDELEEHYRQRTTLKVNIYPEDIAEAVLHFASEERSAKSTGNILNVDGGVKEAYPR